MVNLNAGQILSHLYHTFFKIYENIYFPARKVLSQLRLINRETRNK